MLETKNEVLKSQAEDKEIFFANIVELHPLLAEFFPFIDHKDTEQLKSLIKICNEYEVESLREICISFEELEISFSKFYGLVKKLIEIKKTLAFKFRGLLSYGYWAITVQQN